MFYKSTRDSSVKVSSAQAITQGLSKEGGLFVPESFYEISKQEIDQLALMNYAQKASIILSKFLTDFSEQEIAYCTENAYKAEKFQSENIAEISHLFDGTYMLELWHGPTCAFKDMALQILPFLLTTSAKKVVKDKKIVILVATSGDTGKAALEGFADVENTEILVFYPQDGVSDMQKRQMQTQEGSNLEVVAIKGNFDDAQTGVKEIFSNKSIADELEKKGKMFSSANSINLGRLVPQIVYYISTYCELIKNGEIQNGDEINIAVPTGNFGNILAGYYAKKMGIPIKKMICASNSNNILTDFINTGVYDRNRDFKTTISPSMDILISSNLERLLYDLNGCDDVLLSKWFDDLKLKGKYEVNDKVKNYLKENFAGGYCDDEKTKATIKRIFDKYFYLCDTHTAVAIAVYEEYRERTKDNTKTVIVSTASPYKFSQSVAEGLGLENSTDEYEQLRQISRISRLEIPKELLELEQKQVKFKKIIDVQNMADAVLSFI
jgi:threonine synthase